MQRLQVFHKQLSVARIPGAQRDMSLDLKAVADYHRLECWEFQFHPEAHGAPLVGMMGLGSRKVYSAAKQVSPGAKGSS